MQRSTLTPPLAPLAAALLLGACTGADARPDASVVTDSAGVAIVQSTGPQWSPDEALALAAEPTVAIGDESGAPEYQFGRIHSALRLADGRIVVADGMANEIRYFDGDGRFISKTGGKGGGPGEYQFIHGMRRLGGDSLLISDLMAQRLTVLGADGSLGRMVNMAAAAPPTTPTTQERGGSRITFGGLGRYQIIAPFSDGTILARASGSMGMPPGEGEIVRDSIVLVRLGADGTLRDTVGSFVGDERVVSRSGSGDNMMMMVGPPPFGKSTQIAVDADGFYLGSGDRYEIARYDAEGRLQRLVRRPLEPLAVTPAEVEARKQRDLEAQASGASGQMAAQMRRMTEQRWENATFPKSMPAHGELRVDAARRLWVRETTSATDDRPHYSVFDREGRMLGTIVLPERFRVLDIGEDWLLGAARDELDLEQLRLYRLEPARTRS